MSKRVQTSTTPSFEDYGGTAPENYERYFVPGIGEPVARDLLDACPPHEGERVLDVACGTGVVARLAAEHTGRKGSVTGLDINPGMLGVARAVAPKGIEWCEAPADAIPLPDESFDIAYCQLGLQFFPDKPAALGEIERVLCTGGRMALNVPGPTPDVFRIMGEALANHIKPELANFVNVVFSIDDANALGALIDDAGFNDVVVRAYSKTLRFPDPIAFLWQYVHSTPLAAAVAQSDETSRAAAERDVVAGWEPFIDDGTLVLDQGLLIATARNA